MSLTLAVPIDRAPGETRVPVTPDTTRKLIDLGFTVLIEPGAGAKAQFADALYEQAGAELEADVNRLYQRADVLLKINGPQAHAEGLPGSELDALGSTPEKAKTWISVLAPGQNAPLLEQINGLESLF